MKWPTIFVATSALLAIAWGAWLITLAPKSEPPS